MFFLTNYWLILLIPFLILLPIYLYLEHLNKFRLATALKLVVSGLCFLSGLLGCLTHGGAVQTEQLLIVCGLAFAFVADYLLQYIKLDMRKFIAGIICFAITQSCFIASMIMRYGINWPEFAATAVISLLVLLLMVKQKWQLGRAQIPLSIYTVLLAFMASKTALGLFAGNISISAILMAVGGVCFLLGDICLGLWNYHNGKRLYVNLNWIFYFSAIMLIASSNYPPFMR